MAKENIEIPKGKGKEDIKFRESLIRKTLKPLTGKAIPCPGLGGVHVLVKHSSIGETAHHASRDYHSTIAALDLEHQIQTAQYYKTLLPKDNTKQQGMGFAFVIELHGKCQGKTTKLLIGAMIKGDFVQYCITAMQ